MNPKLQRLLFACLAMYLLFVAGYSFYRFGSAPTDENWFRDVPGKVYVTNSGGSDSIAVGDILQSVDGTRVNSIDEVEKAFKRSEGKSSIPLTLFRLNRDRSYRVTVDAPIPSSHLREIPPAAHVFEVIKDGASDRAGMRPGDLILRINGVGFASSWEADKLMRQAQIGKTVAYDILRENGEITLHVTLARFGIQFSILMMFLSGLLFIGSGTFIVLKSPHLAAARFVGLFLMGMGIFIACVTLQRDPHPDWFTHMRSITIVLGIYFGIAFGFHGDMYFPQERPEVLRWKWLHRGVYVLAALTTAMVFITGGDQVFQLGIALLILYIVTWKIVFRKASDEYRRQIRYIRIAGYTVGLGIIVLAATVMLGTVRIQIVGYVGAILVLIPLSYLYTIGRYHLLDIDFRVRRSIQYWVASFGWGALCVLAFLWLVMFLPQLEINVPNIRITGASIEILDSPLQPERQTTLEKGALMLAAIGAVVALWKINRGGQRFLARSFHRAGYDYRRAASELSEVMAGTLSMKELARGIVEKLAALMHLKRVGVIFFQNQKACCCQEVLGFDGKAWDAFCMTADHDLAEALRQFRGEIKVDYLPDALKRELRRLEFRYVIPIRSKQKLVGALLVGEKLSEATFEEEDLQFLASVSAQASVAIENAFLYEELTEQERMKHELNIARRIQLQSLPQTTPDIPGLDIAGVSLPAMEVGGDYYDYLNGSAQKLTVVVGDVSGKGTSAALYMSKIQGIFRSLHEFGLSPHQLLVKTNELLCRDMEKKSFVTAIGGMFDTGQHSLRFARAGHLPLFHYSAASDSVNRIVPKGLGLGLSPESLFASELEEKTLPYQPGDVFLFVTDGITEAHGAGGEEFGEQRTSEVLRQHHLLSAQEIRDRLMNEVKSFSSGNTQHDDQTVVVVKVRS